MSAAKTLHDMLDHDYGPDGDAALRRRLEAGDDPNAYSEPYGERPLHTATRRRRVSAIEILLDEGADIDATTAGGKTAYAHAIRRRFDDVVEALRRHAPDLTLTPADRFAVAIVETRLADARAILAEHPEAIRTGNPEEDRILADVAGRMDPEPVAFLIEAGADLAAPGLDGATPLHQAAWFGAPENARQLIDAGAPLEVFDPTHEYSPLGWLAHGSRYSGDAENRQDAYVEIAEMLVAAGARVVRPDGDASYRDQLLGDASPRVAEILRKVKP